MRHIPEDPRAFLAQLLACAQRLTYERDAAFQREEDLEVEIAAYEALLDAIFSNAEAGEHE